MAYPQSAYVKAGRAIGVPVFRFLMSVLCRIEVRGLENVPAYGPHFFVINHVDTLDAPLLAVFLPYQPEAITASENFGNPFLGFLMRLYGAIPIKRTQYDRDALEKGLAVLRAGSPLAIAPEGTRRRRPGMQRAKPGIAYLATKTNAPIVPIGIAGTETWIPSWKKLRRPRITMTIGPAFTLPSGQLQREERQARLEAYTSLVMKKVAELLPMEYRGVYA